MRQRLVRADTVMAVAVFLPALALRLLYVNDLHRAGLADFLRLDPLYYHEWAVRIAGGDLLGREAFEMSPLYPYLLGLVYKIFGAGPMAPRVLQSVLGSLTCAGTALLGSRLFGRSAGAAGGMMLALYGPAIFYDGQINKTTLALALGVAFAGALVLSRRRSHGWIAAGGLALGLSALVHENVNVIAPFLLAWALWPADGEGWGPGLRRGAMLVAGYAAAVLPVTIRNLAVSGEMVLITTGGGENFYTGNHPNASGRYAPPPFVRPDPFFEHQDFRDEASRRLGHPVTRSESSRYWWGQGAAYIASNPLAGIRLLWDKLSVFMNAFERPDNFFYDNFRRFSPTLSAPLVSFGIVAPLAFLGMALSAARWRELIPIYAGFAAWLVSALLFFTQSRYRMPAVPFLAIFAGYGVVGLAGAFREREWRTIAAPLLCLVVGFLFVNRDPGNAPSFWAQNDAILGEMYDHAGRLDDAAASFQKGIDGIEPLARGGNPTFVRILGAAQYGLGVTQARRGDEASAERALRAAAACPDPDVRSDALEEIAGLMQKRGDHAGAAAALGGMTAIHPEDFDLRLRHAEALYRAGKMSESLAEIRTALSLAPPSPGRLADAHYGAALVLLATGDRDGAREEMNRAFAIDPRHPGAERIRRSLDGAAEGSR